MVLNVPNLQSLGANLPDQVAPSLGAVLRAQDKLNADLNVYLSSLFAINWQYPQLLNSWVDFDAGLRARYCLIAGRFVVLSGSIKGGTPPSTAFTLPVGYRPGQDINCAVNSNDAFGKLLIQNGNVIANVGNTAIFSLDGCVFLAEE